SSAGVPSSPHSFASRSASGTPAEWIPTSTRPPRGLRSTISAAMRLSAREMPAPSSSSRRSTRPAPGSVVLRTGRIHIRSAMLAPTMTTAGIILIGDEILSGKVADENAVFLIRELRELGVSVRRVLTIPDVLDEIAAAVREFSAAYEHVFTS